MLGFFGPGGLDSKANPTYNCDSPICVESISEEDSAGEEMRIGVIFAHQAGHGSWAVPA